MSLTEILAVIPAWIGAAASVVSAWYAYKATKK